MESCAHVCMYIPTLPVIKYNNVPGVEKKTHLDWCTCCNSTTCHSAGLHFNAWNGIVEPEYLE